MALFKGNLLIGKSNYLEWLSEAKLYLEISGFMPYIDSSEIKPDKDLYYTTSDTPKSNELAIRYYEKLSEYNRNEAKALGALKSIISKDNIERFKDKESAAKLYKAINSTFGESSLDTIGRYYNKLIEANYNLYKSMDEYTSTIQSASIYLKELGCTIPNALLVHIIFKGLPSAFEALISRKYEEIGRDLNIIDINKLISELIAEEARINNSIDLEANKALKFNSNNKTPFCTYYKRKGHLEAKCFIKYPELKTINKNKSNSTYNSHSKFKNKNNSKLKDRPTKDTPTELIMTTIRDSLNSNYINAIKEDRPELNIILDSGATEHYTPNKHWLINYTPVYNEFISVANGIKLPIEGVGSIPIILSNQELTITKVNYIPSLKCTLISSKELANKGWTILFKDDMAILSHKLLKINYNCTWVLNAYYIRFKVNNNIIINYNNKALSQVVYTTNNSDLLTLYHKRLNHLNKDYIIKTIKDFTINNYNNSKNSLIKLDDCESCQLGKFHEIVSYKPLMPPSYNLTYFDIDVCGPFKVKGIINSERYFFTFTCRKSRVVWVYPIKFKSDVIEVFINFYKLIETQFNTLIKVLRLDNAAEFKSAKWTTFIKDKGILCEYTSPYTPAQNGIAEILNKYIIIRLISICREKQIPLGLWPYIVKAIIHIKNRTYNSIINKTPYEEITGTKPNIGYIRVLGSLTYSLIPKELRNGKLNNRANKGILVGFKSSNNYYIYIPKNKKVINTRDIIIKEDLTYKDDDYNNNSSNYNYSASNLLEDDYSSYNYTLNDKDTINDNSTIENNSTINSNNSDIDELQQDQQDNTTIIVNTNSSDNLISQEELATIDELSQDYYITTRSRSRRLLNQEPSNQGSLANKLNNKLALIAYLESITKGDNIFSYAFNSQVENNNTSTNPKALIYKKDLKEDIIVKDPKSYKEAHNSPYSDYWLKAEQAELNSLISNNTWTKVKSNTIDTISVIKPLKTRWVYKIKEYNDYYEFKARFVAKGFEQLYGLDYIDNYASVIKQIAWKLVFALAVNNKWLIYKIDMISAFTQGDIDINHLYLNPPEGTNLSNNNYLLKLNKALYGLKQSARIWYFTLYNVLIELKFKVLNSENCIFINKDKDIIICVYVDDLAIISPNIDTINSTIKSLETYFKLKNLGPVKDYLGIEIDYNINKGYLKLSQTKYISKLLDKYNMTDAKPTITPMDNKTAYKLIPNNKLATKETIKWFQGVIGSLLYLTLGTRPDIAYSVIKLSRYTANPSEEHIIAIKRVLRYIKGTMNYSINYYRSNDSHYISAYTDADYAGDLNTAKSTSGYIFYLANGPISWKSKLQTIIAQSTTEAEYIAINASAKEAIYIKSILGELGYYKQDKFPIYSDNNGALLLAKNPVFHERTKHISVKYHYIRDLIDKGIIDLIYINTSEQKADGLTKALERVKFKGFLNYLGFI